MSHFLLLLQYPFQTAYPKYLSSFQEIPMMPVVGKGHGFGTFLAFVAKRILTSAVHPHGLFGLFRKIISLLSTVMSIYGAAFKS